MSNKQEGYTGSKSWAKLNEELMGCSNLKVLFKMLETEKKGKARKQFLSRIHSRINKVRADAERAELTKVVRS